ncbi:MAG: hypothetical protein Kow0077_22190 [Anaerolineae bacterium]
MRTIEQVRTAWRVTREHAWLWLFGLVLLGMSSGNIDLTLPVTYNLAGAPEHVGVPAVMGMVLVAGVLLVVGVTLWVLGALARGALIVALDRILREEDVTWGAALEAGLAGFGRVFLLGMPVAIPALLLTFVAYTAALSGLSRRGETPALTTVMAVLLALCGVLVVMSLFLTLVQHLADRAALLEGLGPLAAFRRGWQLLAQNHARLRGGILVWLGVSLTLRLLLAVPATGLILPTVFAAIAGRPVETGVLAILCVAGFLTVMVSLLFAVGNVFTAALWTLLFRECLAAEIAQADAAHRLVPDEASFAAEYAPVTGATNDNESGME